MPGDEERDAFGTTYRKLSDSDFCDISEKSIRYPTVSGVCIYICACTRTRAQVTDDHIQLGTIEFDTGFVNVVAVYRAICFRPFVNEVLDAAVSHVTELGFFAEVGPLEVFVSRLVSKRLAVGCTGSCSAAVVFCFVVVVVVVVVSFCFVSRAS